MKPSSFIDVPLKKPWLKRWLYRGVKVSIVFGGIGFLANAWTNFDRYQESSKASVRNEMGYRCAANLSDTALTQGLNIYGNIDISKLGCAASTFIVSMPEVRDMRAGKMDFSPPYKPFYLRDSLAAALLSSVLSLLAMTGLIVLFGIGRWVWI